MEDKPMDHSEKLLFTHTIGEKEPHSIAERRAILLQAIPEIERRYKELRGNAGIRSLKIPEEVSTEALSFYNAVVVDGRFIGELVKNPQAVADKLGLRVDPRVFEHLTDVVAAAMPRVHPESPIIAIATVIA